MSIGFCCVSMPTLFRLLAHHLPSHKKIRSWLNSRYTSAKLKRSTDSAWKSSRLGRILLFNKSETPNRSRDSYLDTEGNNRGRLDLDTLSSPYGQGSMKKSVLTFIDGGENNVFDDDGIHCEIELQQHSRQYDSC